MEKVLMSLDISGNFHEGKGTTGVCIRKGEDLELSEIKASQYDSAEDYWDAHISLIQQMFPDQLIIEGYRLYHHQGQSAQSQANSVMETSQLLGVLRAAAHSLEIPVTIQYASEIKKRWSERVLVHLEYLEQKGKRYYFKGKPTSTHMRDALKHMLHFLLKEERKL